MKRGFTLIELMIVLAIAGIVLITSFNFVNFGGSTLSGGFNGLVETRCIDGYSYVVGQDGRVTQTLNELGKGVRCNEQ